MTDKTGSESPANPELKFLPLRLRMLIMSCVST